jgi:DNA polymerase-3 subunit alpha
MDDIEFVNLHHHTTFSFGDGYGPPAVHVARAAELGYSAIAFTEHGNVSSHFQGEKAALKAGIKPIFGMEAYCGPTDTEQRSAWKYHLSILASDAEGYRSLNRIVTDSYLAFYYHPTVSGASLASNRNGLIILSGCSGSLLACSLLGGKGIPVPDEPDMGAAEDIIWQFKDVFGSDYYLEIQPFWELEKTTAMNVAYLELSALTDTPLVVTHDVHYPKPDDYDMQAILHAVHRGKASVDDAMREWNYRVPMTLPSSDNDLQVRLMRTGLDFRSAWEAIEMSSYIASQCNVTLPKADPLLYPALPKDMEPWK